MNSPI